MIIHTHVPHMITFFQPITFLQPVHAQYTCGVLAEVGDNCDQACNSFGAICSMESLQDFNPLFQSSGDMNSFLDLYPGGLSCTNSASMTSQNPHRPQYKEGTGLCAPSLNARMGAAVNPHDGCGTTDAVCQPFDCGALPPDPTVDSKRRICGCVFGTHTDWGLQNGAAVVTSHSNFNVKCSNYTGYLDAGRENHPYMTFTGDPSPGGEGGYLCGTVGNEAGGGNTGSCNEACTALGATCTSNALAEFNRFVDNEDGFVRFLRLFNTAADGNLQCSRIAGSGGGAVQRPLLKGAGQCLPSKSGAGRTAAWDCGEPAPSGDSKKRVCGCKFTSSTHWGNTARTTSFWHGNVRCGDYNSYVHTTTTSTSTMSVSTTSSSTITTSSTTAAETTTTTTATVAGETTTSTAGVSGTTTTIATVAGSETSTTTVVSTSSANDETSTAAPSTAGLNSTDSTVSPAVSIGTTQTDTTTGITIAADDSGGISTTTVIPALASSFTTSGIISGDSGILDSGNSGTTEINTTAAMNITNISITTIAAAAVPVPVLETEEPETDPPIGAGFQSAERQAEFAANTATTSAAVVGVACGFAILGVAIQELSRKGGEMFAERIQGYVMKIAGYLGCVKDQEEEDEKLREQLLLELREKRRLEKEANGRKFGNSSGSSQSKSSLGKSKSMLVDLDAPPEELLKGDEGSARDTVETSAEAARNESVATTAAPARRLSRQQSYILNFATEEEAKIVETAMSTLKKRRSSVNLSRGNTRSLDSSNAGVTSAFARQGSSVDGASGASGASAKVPKRRSFLIRGNSGVADNSTADTKEEVLSALNEAVAVQNDVVSAKDQEDANGKIDPDTVKIDFSGENSASEMRKSALKKSDTNASMASVDDSSTLDRGKSISHFKTLASTESLAMELDEAFALEKKRQEQKQKKMKLAACIIAALLVTSLLAYLMATEEEYRRLVTDGAILYPLFLALMVFLVQRIIAKIISRYFDKAFEKALLKWKKFYKEHKFLVLGTACFLVFAIMGFMVYRFASNESARRDFFKAETFLNTILLVMAMAFGSIFLIVSELFEGRLGAAAVQAAVAAQDQVIDSALGEKEEQLTEKTVKVGLKVALKFPFHGVEKVVIKPIAAEVKDVTTESKSLSAVQQLRLRRLSLASANSSLVAGKRMSMMSNVGGNVGGGGGNDASAHAASGATSAGVGGVVTGVSSAGTAGSTSSTGTTEVVVERVPNLSEDFLKQEKIIRKSSSSSGSSMNLADVGDDFDPTKPMSIQLSENQKIHIRELLEAEEKENQTSSTMIEDQPMPEQMIFVPHKLCVGEVIRVVKPATQDKSTAVLKSKNSTSSIDSSKAGYFGKKKSTESQTGGLDPTSTVSTAATDVTTAAAKNKTKGGGSTSSLSSLTGGEENNEDADPSTAPSAVKLAEDLAKDCYVYVMFEQLELAVRLRPEDLVKNEATKSHGLPKKQPAESGVTGPVGKVGNSRKRSDSLLSTGSEISGEVPEVSPQVIAEKPTTQPEPIVKEETSPATAPPTSTTGRPPIETDADVLIDAREKELLEKVLAEKSSEAGVTTGVTIEPRIKEKSPKEPEEGKKIALGGYIDKTGESAPEEPVEEQFATKDLEISASDRMKKVKKSNFTSSDVITGVRSIRRETTIFTPGQSRQIKNAIGTSMSKTQSDGGTSELNTAKPSERGRPRLGTLHAKALPVGKTQSLKSINTTTAHKKEESLIREDLRQQTAMATAAAANATTTTTGNAEVLPTRSLGMLSLPKSGPRSSAGGINTSPSPRTNGLVTKKSAALVRSAQQVSSAAKMFQADMKSHDIASRRDATRRGNGIGVKSVSDDGSGGGYSAGKNVGNKEEAFSREDISKSVEAVAARNGLKHEGIDI